MEEPKGTEQTTILTDFNFENIIFKVIPYFLSHSLSSVKYANNPKAADRKFFCCLFFITKPM